MELIDQRELTGLGLVPLAVPALQLARDVVLLLPEVAEPDGIGVHRMDPGEGVGDGVPSVAARLRSDL